MFFDGDLQEENKSRTYKYDHAFWERDPGEKKKKKKKKMKEWI
jgi:hypothetical protein